MLVFQIEVPREGGEMGIRGRSGSVTYAHQTVLRHPARFLALVALRGAAAHVEEAEWWLAAVAVRFEDGV